MTDLEFPTVNPADLLNAWRLTHGLASGHGNQQVAMTGSMYERATGSGENAKAVWARVSILQLMEKNQLLNDWIHNRDIDEVVIRVMAEFPLKPMKPGVRQQAPFDDILKGIKKAAPITRRQ